jgi:hypothetical protein
VKVPLFLEEEERFLFNLTMRQCLLLFIGAGISWLLFLRCLDWITNPLLALWVGLIAACLAFAATVIVAFCKIGGRGLEEWGIVWLAYQSQPHLFLWTPPEEK